MGRIVMHAYRVEMTGNFHMTPAVWRTKRDGVIPANGKPTKENLERYVLDFLKSTNPGGVNEHLTKSLGVLPMIHSARIIDNRTGETVAEWKAPAFLAV